MTQLQVTSLTLRVLNVNCLMKRIAEIRHLPVSLDILAVNETKIDEAIPYNDINISGNKLLLVLEEIIDKKLLMHPV